MLVRFLRISNIVAAREHEDQRNWSRVNYRVPVLEQSPSVRSSADNRAKLRRGGARTGPAFARNAKGVDWIGTKGQIGSGLVS